MEAKDVELEHRIRDIIAVVADDMDAVTFDVEDRVAYIEGVVASDRERRLISDLVRRLDGIAGVVTCLFVEHILERASDCRPSPLHPHSTLIR